MLVPCTMQHGFISENTTTLILLRALRLIMWQYICNVVTVWALVSSKSWVSFALWQVSFAAGVGIFSLPLRPDQLGGSSSLRMDNGRKVAGTCTQLRWRIFGVVLACPHISARYGAKIFTSLVLKYFHEKDYFKKENKIGSRKVHSSNASGKTAFYLQMTTHSERIYSFSWANS